MASYWCMAYIQGHVLCCPCWSKCVYTSMSPKVYILTLNLQTVTITIRSLTRRFTALAVVRTSQMHQPNPTSRRSQSHPWVVSLITVIIFGHLHPLGRSSPEFSSL